MLQRFLGQFHNIGLTASPAWPRAETFNGLHKVLQIFFFPLSDIMDLRHQTSAMCIIMLGGEGGEREDTHTWSATKVGNPIPATIPVAKRNNQQTTHTSHYRSRPVEFF